MAGYWSPDDLKELTKAIKEFAEPELMYLYGSHSRGQAIRFSDIDIMLVESKKGSGDIKRQFKGVLLDLYMVSRPKFEKYKNVESSIICKATKGVKV